jgi:guanylate kinase
VRAKKTSKLLVIGGTSGAGKDTTVQTALGTEVLVQGITTRAMRPGETNGGVYKFVNKFHFILLLLTGQLLNFNYYSGHFYGYSKKDYKEKTEKFGTSVIIATVDTREHFVKKFGATTIFIKADYDDVKANIEARGDAPDVIVNRLSKFKEEAARENEYDYVLTNKRGHLFETVAEFNNIINSLKQTKPSFK